MPFDQPTPRSLTPVSIRANAPIASGIYGISNAREWIYIGETDNIQGTLLSHLRELDTSLMKRRPTGFVFEFALENVGTEGDTPVGETQATSRRYPK